MSGKLFEGGNSTLLQQNAKAPLGKAIKAHLMRIQQSFSGDKTSNGYKRLCNILQMNELDGGVKYNELTQLKHIMGKLLPTSEEFNTLGGNMMKAWLDISLSSMENSVKNDKIARQRAGETNVFRRAHTKDRQGKSKNKSTIGRIQTKNVSKSISNNKSVVLSENNNDRRIVRISEEQANYYIL